MLSMHGHIYSILCSITIALIKAVRNDAPDFTSLLKTPLNLLEDDCINRTLMVAVETGSHKNAAKLVVYALSRLSQNQFTSLPSEMGWYLKSCTKLDLQQNELSEIPHCLLELPSISELNLSHNEIVEIPDVPEWSETLLKLDFSFNLLRSLPDSAVAVNLKSLNISNNQFCTVPQCVCSFVSLTTLNLANNSKIRVLPSELGRLRNLTNLNLDGLDNLKDPPKSAHKATTDCVHYLYNQLQNPCGYFRMKLILVGKQAVGKSTIVTRLTGHISNKPTHGVDISEWTLKYFPARNRKYLYFNIWDFSGQEEYHAVYHCFMSQRSLYLLVWNITEGDNGVADLKLWLSDISLLAPDSCVIIVGTFLDKVSEEDRQAGKVDHLLQKVQELTAQYQHIFVAKITMVGLQGRMENVAQLKDDIYNAASEYKINGQCVMGAKLPSSYHKLDAELARIRQKVKDGKHKPIMHFAEIKRIVRDLGLLDISADEELRTAINIFHQVGILLHYDDHKHNLDDLYFVDPQWLCYLLSTVVSVKQNNRNMQQGMLHTGGIPLFQDKRFPFSQCLTLLSRLEVIVSLDKECKTILIPSLLSDDHSDVANKINSIDKNCFKRLIQFYPSVLGGSHPIPPGLWSHLLARVINSVKEVKNVLCDQTPPEFKDSGITDATTDIFKLCFQIECLSEKATNKREDCISITCSSTIEGRRIFGHLVDTVEQLITEWYPGLAGVVKQKAPCCKCLETDVSKPFEFRVDKLLDLVADHKLTTECGLSHKVQLIDVVPDLLLADLDPLFHLDPNEVIYNKDKENILGTGAFGKIYCGEYKDLSVAIKLYTNGNVNNKFKELRSDIKKLQQSHHPCLVCMVGVTVHPTMSVVLEYAPLGTLHSTLLQEQEAFSRIVLYRIAIQVVSALQFLHNSDIIFRDLKADNVLLWSLSPDHLINCKLTDFNIATHSNSKRLRGLHSVKGFIAPEVSHYDHTMYDHRVDIFSFGMFLYQLLARRHPFHNIKPSEIETAIAKEQRPLLEDVTVAQSGLFYMTQIMQLCWAGSADDRPEMQKIIKWLSTPTLQLIMSVVPITSEFSLRNGCFAIPTITSNESELSPMSSDVWICCDGATGIEINIFKTNTMVKTGRHFVRDDQVCCIKQCGDHIWLASRVGLECGSVDIFNQKTQDLIHHIKIGDMSVSCINSSDHVVYMGTMEGYCFTFPVDIETVRREVKPKYKHLSEYRIDGIVLTQTCLWASTHNQILFLNPESFDKQGVIERTKHKVGQIMVSDDGDQVWSADIGGVIFSSWNARQCVHICDVDVSVVAEKKCNVTDPQDQVITVMCTALDTVWIGLASGNIIVFSMNPPGEMLMSFKPYGSYVRFLSATKYPGPCQKEECMIISGGKPYQPDDSFKELSDHSVSNHSVDKSGVVILWEVLPAKYMRQTQYLHDGSSWQSYSSLEKAMTDTGFAASKGCIPFMQGSVESKQQVSNMNEHIQVSHQ